MHSPLIVTVVAILLLDVWAGVPSRSSPLDAGATPNSSEVLASIPVGMWPTSIAFDDANGLLYVANDASGDVSVINGTTNTVVGSIPIANCPFGIAWDSANGDLYVAGDCTSNVAVIDGATNAVVGNVGVGSPATGVAVDSSTNQIFVAAFPSLCTFCNNTEGYLAVIDGTTNTMSGSVALGSRPSGGFAFDPANGDVYAGEYFTGNVSVVDGKTNTLIGNVTVGNGSGVETTYGAAYDSSAKAVYVTVWEVGVLDVIDTVTNRVSQQIPVGSYPWGVAVDEWNGDIFVTSGTSNVTVLAQSTIISRITVGQSPQGLAFDGRNGDVYVANYFSDNVTVLSGELVLPVLSVPVSFLLASGLLAVGIGMALIAAVVYHSRRGKAVVTPPYQRQSNK